MCRRAAARIAVFTSETAMRASFVRKAGKRKVNEVMRESASYRNVVSTIMSINWDED